MESSGLWSLSRQFDSYTEKIIFLFFLGLNSILIPFIIWGSNLKKQSIMDPIVNTSYSSISIIILSILIFAAGFQLLSNLFRFYEIFYYQSYYFSQDEYDAALKQNKTNRWVSTFGAIFKYSPIVITDLIRYI